MSLLRFLLLLLGPVVYVLIVIKHKFIYFDVVFCSVSMRSGHFLRLLTIVSNMHDPCLRHLWTDCSVSYYGVLRPSTFMTRIEPWILWVLLRFVKFSFTPSVQFLERRFFSPESPFFFCLLAFVLCFSDCHFFRGNPAFIPFIKSTLAPNYVPSDPLFVSL